MADAYMRRVLELPDDGHVPEEGLPWTSVALEWIGAGFGYFGALLMAIGSLLAAVNITILFSNRVLGTSFAGLWITHKRKLSLLHIRRVLAKNIVVSLEFLVAADVIETLARPISLQTYASLVKISIIVFIRTVMALHLAHELHEIEHELSKRRERRHSLLALGLAVPVGLQAKSDQAGGDEDDSDGYDDDEATGKDSHHAHEAESALVDASPAVVLAEDIEASLDGSGHAHEL